MPAATPADSAYPSPSDPVWSSRRALALYAGLWLFALLVRGFYLWAIHDAALFSLLFGDARIYDAWAVQISGGDWLGSQAFYQAPLYPYFLAAVYKFLGHDLLAVRIVQAVLGASSCLFLALAGARFFSRRVGLLAGLLLAVYPFAIYFDGLIQKTVLDTFLLTLLLWLLGVLQYRPRPRLAAAAGATLGLLALSRENALLLALVLVPWLWLNFPLEARHRRLVRSVAFLAGLFAILLPVAARNAALGGGWQPTTAQFGPNFFIGNNPLANGLYAPLVPGRSDPLFEQSDATRLAEAALGHPLFPAEVSRYWASQAVAAIRAHPGSWVGLLGHKTLLLLNSFEISDSEDPYTYSDSSLLLRVLGALFHFGVLLPLAVFGLVLTWPQRRRLVVLYLSLLTYGASVVLFYIFARYRFPLVPWLILFAAAGLVAASQQARSHRFRPIWFALIPAGLAALVANWPIFSPDDARGITAYNLARALAQIPRRESAAAASYHASLNFLPKFAEAHNGLGRVLAAQGHAAAAADEFRSALVLKPDYAEAGVNLADLLAAQGDLPSAALDYQHALLLDPTLVAAHAGLASILVRQQQFPAAATEYESALRLAPANASLHYNLANVLVAEKQFDGAIGHYQAALRLQPDLAVAAFNLGNVYALRSDWPAAAAQYQAVLRAQPDFLAALHNLANTYAELGRFPAAIIAAQKAVNLAEQQGDPALAQSLRAQIALFQQNRAH